MPLSIPMEFTHGGFVLVFLHFAMICAKHLCPSLESKNCGTFMFSALKDAIICVYFTVESLW